MDQVAFRSDTVLSDVHLLLPNARHLMARLNSVGQPVFVSKFRILREEEQVEVQDSVKSDLGVLLDEDGDLVVTRKPNRMLCDREKIHPVILSQAGEAVSDEEDDEAEDKECAKDIIRIEHTMATPLEDVGKQIWRGAFLLSDFILSHPAVFQEATVLELGAGTGLASIIMARVAKKVYCTDVGEDLLSMCQRNVALNSHYTEPAAERGVKVRQLDWTADDFLTDADAEFGWSEEEVADLHDNTTFVIAADVCYDDDLTDALFQTLYRITSNLRSPSTAYFSIEKRLNFTLRHMDVSCEAYNHFRLCLKQLADMKDGKMKFTVEPVPCSFPQSFQYERVDQLELWKVSASAV
ncbi:methyltransferase-like protein 22 isoform X1 [Pygocentrus nattereri]|uniref:Methyltransferase like 22 n=1 Tax=Pygocentrus nattereri TaxID=42514 RepID=A0AAR2LZM7_PYGNA|nr:methyltransferase-like protein 22 isoform X1 [Pygocentrus nattereri]XP_017562452.1 methyltransferase-like protein 22 isoform X1 [Pygocentrus nattereri]XP_037400659.1 methyltransferase-like protein 22 isoform X1 [Pygocentrus nattereri]